ncbi:hypothetical protein ccbrp13_62120 [Ktedonobacteria bacterium brp13]|nr:hypothetical protein ccbrp13_62120 [Ktedonobacteria bacterium brp13]
MQIPHRKAISHQRWAYLLSCHPCPSPQTTKQQYDSILGEPIARLREKERLVVDSSLRHTLYTYAPPTQPMLIQIHTHRVQRIVSKWESSSLEAVAPHHEHALLSVYIPKT